MWRAIWIRLTEQKADYAFRALLDGADHRPHVGARARFRLVNFRYRGSRRLLEKALNRLNESPVSESQKRGIAIPSLYAIGGKSYVRVCNLNQRSQRSDFEALVQTCEELGVELEARAGHKTVQHVKIRRVAARR